MFDDLRKIYTTKTYSLTAAHTQMVSQMADELASREGKMISDGEVVRRAIDLLWAATYASALPRPEGAQVVPLVLVTDDDDPELPVPELA